MFSKLKQDNQYILLMIDEIHLIEPKDILTLLDIAKNYSQISLLMVSREKDWKRIRENHRIKFDEIITLRHYTPDEIFHILKYRSDVAFQKNIITEDVLRLISRIVEKNKNIRNGIEILRNCASLCVEKHLVQITAEMVREVSTNIYPRFRNDLITWLGEREKLILYGIARAIINQGNTYTLINDAYEEYQKICDEYQKFCEYTYTNNPEIYHDYEDHFIKPVSKIRFKKHIIQLAELKLIISQIGRTEAPIRRKHLEISLLDISAERFSVLLKEVIDNMYLRAFT